MDVQLGAEQTVDFKLPLATVSETVDVVAQQRRSSTSRAPARPTTSRTPSRNRCRRSRAASTDIARISPMFNAQGGGAGDGASVVSVAGNSSRYNNLQIDGAVNNDLFGLASSAGTPGGTAETQPISLDAIQEIQLVVSPYDVRQGGFTGGGINADHQERHQRIHGTGVLLRPQPGLGRQGRRPTRRSRRSRTSRAAAASAGRS